MTDVQTFGLTMLVVKLLSRLKNKKCGFNPQGGGGFGLNPHFLKSVDLGGVFLLFLHIFALFGPSWTILVCQIVRGVYLKASLREGFIRNKKKRLWIFTTFFWTPPPPKKLWNIGSLFFFLNDLKDILCRRKKITLENNKNFMKISEIYPNLLKFSNFQWSCGVPPPCKKISLQIWMIQSMYEKK